MISAIMTIWIDCVSEFQEVDCHTSLEAVYDPVHFDFDIEEFLSEMGWLSFEHGGICPVCRKQYHD